MIDLLDKTASQVLPVLWRATWQGSIFILAVWAVCRFVPHVGPRTRFWLWWFACLQLGVRLIAPPVELAVLPSVAARSAHVTARLDAPEMASLSAHSAIWNPVPAAPQSSRPSRPALPKSQEPGDISRAEAPPPRTPWTKKVSTASPQNDAGPAGASFHLEPALIKPRTGRFVPRVATVTAIRPAFLQRHTLTWGAGLLSLWCAGVLGALVGALAKWVRTQKMIGSSRAVTSPTVRRLAAELTTRRRSILVREGVDVPCPLLTGSFRPTILLPFGWADNQDEETLKMALAHEAAHLRSADLWLALIPSITRTLFFFHPLAWLCANQAMAACEEACDVEAVRLSGAVPSVYARALIGLATDPALNARPSGINLGGSLGTSFSYRTLRRRIHMLKNPLQPGPTGRRLATALVALSAVCALPWSVTAQNAAAKHLATHRRHHKRAVRHFVATKAQVKVSPASPAAPATPARAAIAMIQPAPAAFIPAPRYAVTLTPPVAPPPPPAPPRAPSVSVPVPTFTPPFQAAPTPQGGAPTAAAGVSVIPPLPSPSAADPTEAAPAPASPSPFGSQVTGSGFGSASLPSASGSAIGTASARSVFAEVQALPSPSLTPPADGFGSVRTPSTRTTSSSVTPTPQILWTPAVPQATRTLTDQAALWETGVAPVTAANGRVSIHFMRVRIYEALSQVFQAAHIDFAISSDVEAGGMVTCSLHDMPIERALKTLLQTVHQPLTYRVEGGVYVIFPRAQ